MSMTVDELVAAINREYPTRDWDQQCQRLVWNAIWLSTGIAESRMITYGSAIEAYRSSSIVSTNSSNAPLGAIHYWSMGEFGHNGVEVGGGMMIHTSDHATKTRIYGKHFFLSPVSSYSKGTYLGWSRQNGSNPQVAITSYVPTVRPQADVKRVTAYLNARGIILNGVTLSSSADEDGIPGPNLYLMIQVAGTADGVYNGEVDGITGPKTEAAFDHYTTVSIPKPPVEPAPKTWMDGIDISGWQEGIDLAAVPADFVIVKATEGIDFISTEFVKNVDATLALDKPAGVYHFASGGDVQAEADWFVKNAKQYAGRAIPFLDFEGGALAQGAGWALAWLEAVEAAWGAKPILYLQGSEASKESYRIIADAGFKLWRAAYGDNEPGGYEKAPKTDTPDNGVWPACTMRQYLSTGRLLGWSGNLDLNIFYGLAADWSALARVNIPVEPDPPVEKPVEPPDSTAPAKPKTPPIWVILTSGIGILAIVTAAILRALGVIA